MPPESPETQSMEELLEQIRRIVAAETRITADGNSDHANGMSMAAEKMEPLVLSQAMVYRGEDDLSPLHQPAAKMAEPSAPHDDIFTDPFASFDSFAAGKNDSPPSKADATSFDNLAMVDPFDINGGVNDQAGVDDIFNSPNFGAGGNSPMEASRPVSMDFTADSPAAAPPVAAAHAPAVPMADPFDFSIKSESSMGFSPDFSTEIPVPPPPPPPIPNDRRVAIDDGLLSDITAKMVRDNFAKLDSSRAIPDPVSKREIINDHARSQISMEELVLDCVKPAVKEWLEMNLNRIVELLVKEEISRVSPRRK